MSLPDVKESYSRCCVNPTFFDRFYQTFLSSYPAIAPMFANTEMAKQKQLLRQGISMMFMHLGGNGVGTTALDRIGESHNRNHLNVNPKWYDFWIESLVTTVKACDEKMTPALEAEWRKTLRTGVDRITSFYDK